MPRGEMVLNSLGLNGELSFGQMAFKELDFWG